MDAVRLVAFSDYLCPWCYNGSLRLERLEEFLEARRFRQALDAEVFLEKDLARVLRVLRGEDDAVEGRTRAASAGSPARRNSARIRSTVGAKSASCAAMAVRRSDTAGSSGSMAAASEACW